MSNPKLINLTLVINNVSEDKSGPQALPSSLSADTNKAAHFSVCIRVRHRHSKYTP